jgi:hypothetical protein
MFSFLCPALSAQSTLPALTALDHDTQQLYRATQSHIVRVLVPVRIPTAHPLIKWRMQFDRDLQNQLEQARASDDSQRFFVQPATTQSSSAPEASAPPTPAVTTINVECLGMILNTHGDVLLPLFIDPAYVQQVQVTVDERDVTKGTVRSVDRQTGLTILRLAKPAGKPVRFAQVKPEPGSLVLMLAPTRRSARLSVWTGGVDDNSTILVNAAGEFAAIVRNGHALYPATFLPIVDQLLKSGMVQRARLGVDILEVPIDDPQRLKFPALGARSAAYVDAVLPDSPAAKAGIQPGDLILSVAGEAVADIPTFAAAIANRRGRTSLLLLRDGQEHTLTVDLQAHP